MESRSIVAPTRTRRLQLRLVLGPTGSGKTRRSVELARAADAPVVVLDRVQCHRELAIGSGRADPGPVRRIFLADRRVADGVLPAAAAYDRLVRVLAGLRAAGSPTVLLEGGSVSLVAAMTASRGWRQDTDVVVEQVRPADPEAYARGVRARVEDMLGRPGRTMLDEVRGLWPDPRTRVVLAGIVGYREILTAGQGPDFRFTGARLDRLAADITAATLRYAEVQSAGLDALATVPGGGDG